MVLPAQPNGDEEGNYDDISVQNYIVAGLLIVVMSNRSGQQDDSMALFFANCYEI